MKKGIFMTIISLVLIFSLVACNSSKPSDTNAGGEEVDSGSKVSMTLSIPDPESSSIGQAASEFAKRVNEESNGSIEMKVYANGSLYGGDPAAAVKQLGAGSLDALILSTSLYANFIPEFNVISIPYLYDDTDQFVEYLNSDLGDELLASLDELGIKGTGLWTRSFRQITNSKKAINEPADLKGVKLRVPNNPLWVEYFKATGAVPTPMAFGEVYNALQLSTIDGQENPVDVPMSSKFYEVQDYLTMSNHMADGWIVGFNQEKFNKLSSEQQELLIQISKEMQEWKLDYDNEQDEQIIEQLVDEGMEMNTISEENREKFIEVSKGLYDKFAELVKNDEFFQKTLEFVGKN